VLVRSGRKFFSRQIFKSTLKKILEKQKQVITRNSENYTFPRKKQANKNFNRTKLRYLICFCFCFCFCFEHIQLPAKLLDYFLRSNKSNINQSVFVFVLPPQD